MLCVQKCSGIQTRFLWWLPNMGQHVACHELLTVVAQRIPHWFLVNNIAKKCKIAVHFVCTVSATPCQFTLCPKRHDCGTVAVGCTAQQRVPGSNPDDGNSFFNYFFFLKYLNIGQIFKYLPNI